MKKVLALLCAMALASPAFADGAYIGGTVGMTSVNVCSGANVPAGVTCDDQSTGWKALVGFEVTKNIAIEAAYVDLGKVSISGPGGSGEITSKGWDFSGIGTVWLSDKIGLFGRFGVYGMDLKARSNVGFNADESESGITYGVGARVDLTKNLSLRGEFQIYDDVGGENIDLIGITLLFRF